MAKLRKSEAFTAEREREIKQVSKKREKKKKQPSLATTIFIPLIHL